MEGWRAAIKAGQLPSFRLEVIIAAIQDLGPDVDEQVRSKLAWEVHGRFFRILRKAVGRNHLNSGDDIIHRTIFKLFEAIGNLNSNDGRALRKPCYSLIKLRMIDAIREENRERRTPEDFLETGKSSDDEVEEHVPFPDDTELEKAEVTESEGSVNETPGITRATPPSKAPEPDEDEDAAPVKASYDPSLFDGVIEMQQNIDIKRLLESAIPNDRKRLAFHLFMEGIPRKTIDENTHSIAEALGKDESTIRAWIKEIQEVLKTKVSKP